MNQEELGNDPEAKILFLFENWIQFGADARTEEVVRPLVQMDYRSTPLNANQKGRLMFVQTIIHEMTMEGSGLNKEDPSEPKIYSSHNEAVVKPSKKIRRELKSKIPHMETFERMNLMPFFVEKLRQVRTLKICMGTKDEIPPFFHLFSNLECLTIESGNDAEIPNTIFEMRSLRELNLPSWRALRKVGPSIRQLHGLEKINFSGCRKLSEIAPELMNLQNLKHVDLSSTAISFIPSGVLSNPSVENLIMDNCSSLFHVDEAIATMKGLRNLSLQDGSFDSLTSIPNLEILNLSGSEKCRSIGMFENLKKLNLLGTHVNVLLEDVCNFSKIEDLRISFWNQRVRTPCLLPKLRVLHIYDYNAVQFPPFVFECEYLEEIHLRDAPAITYVEPDLYKLKHLKVIKFINCGLECLFFGISNLENLTFLDISHCRNFKELPHDLGLLGKLEYLYLNQTGIVDIPEGTLDMKSLRYVVNAAGQIVMDKDAEERAEKFAALLLEFIKK